MRYDETAKNNDITNNKGKSAEKESERERKTNCIKNNNKIITTIKLPTPNCAKKYKVNVLLLLLMMMMVPQPPLRQMLLCCGGCKK